VLPANRLQRAPAIGDVDGLVPDVAKVARAEAAEKVEDFLGPGTASEAGDAGVSLGLVPILHRIKERPFRLIGSRHGGLIHAGHRPIALFHVARLRGLELIHGPKHRQPPIRIRRVETRQVRGIHHEDRMKLEADGPGLDVAHAGQQQCREHFAISHAAANAARDLLEHPLPRALLDQPHQRFDLGPEADEFRIQRAFRGGNLRKTGEKIKVSQPDQSAGRGDGRFEK
jgi:hypothetical protein